MTEQNFDPILDDEIDVEPYEGEPDADAPEISDDGTQDDWEDADA